MMSKCIWAYGSRWQRAAMATARAGSPGLRSRENELGKAPVFGTSEPTLSDILPSTRPYLLNLPNSTFSWGPRV